MLPRFDDFEVIDRIQVERMRYHKTTGKFPTRLVLTPVDLLELNAWLVSTDPDVLQVQYVGVDKIAEPEVLGMRYRLDAYAKSMRVYFQES